MNIKLENRLYKKFKFLKRKVMSSIDCGDGWYPIIDSMCAELKALATLPDDFVITKVFNKFGDMKVFSRNGNNGTRAIIERAFDKSMEICDSCGNDKDQEQCPKCTVPVVDYSDPEDEGIEDEDGTSCPTGCTGCVNCPQQTP